MDQVYWFYEGLEFKLHPSIIFAEPGISDWRNWLGRTSPVQQVVGSNPGRDTCLVWNSGKFCNASFLGGRIDKDPLEGTTVFRAILGINLLL